MRTITLPLLLELKNGNYALTEYVLKSPDLQRQCVKGNDDWRQVRRVLAQIERGEIELRPTDNVVPLRP